jgi:hypothetical protein
MKRRITIIALIAFAALIIVALTVTFPARAGGATQISGVGLFGGSCDSYEDTPFVFLTGDLNGCFYSFAESYKCSTGGVYIERGTNRFEGEDGTFEATYHFVAKFEECDVETAMPGGDEIHGRCHHPIVPGSGTGVFDGVTGRLDFKDHIVDGVPIKTYYRGHLKK